MASDVMRVRLHLRQIRVVEVLLDTPTVLRVRVESTLRRSRCPFCGFKCHRVHDIREREVARLGGVGSANDVGVDAASGSVAVTAVSGSWRSTLSSTGG